MVSLKWKDIAGKLTNYGKFDSLMPRLKRSIPFHFALDGTDSRELVGLDIGVGRLKLISINSSSTPMVVEKFAIAEIPGNAMTGDEVNDVNEVSQVIKNVVDSNNLNIKHAALAIPRSLAIIKHVNVDKRLHEDDLESKAWIEANRHFPDVVGDIYLDYAITGPALNDPDMNELLLVAARKKHIEPYLEICMQSGLTLKLVDVSSYALYRTLDLVQQQNEGETSALLNLNVAQSSLIVASGGRLVHAHDQVFDGSKLLKQTHGYLMKQLTQNHVEGLKLSISDVGYNDLLKENFISHLRHTVHFFYTSQPNTKMDKIYLSGDCGNVPDLPAFIQQELGISTEILNPFKDMKTSDRVRPDDLEKAASSLALATGLALSDVKW